MTPAAVDFDRHLARESDRFLEAVLLAPPDARVPSCPDWDADDLLWHLAKVQHWWATVLASRPEKPGQDEGAQDDFVRPTDRKGLAAAYRSATTALRSQLAEADDDEAAYTWHLTIHTAGFIRRRQAHEALIHRVDAELTAGALTPLPTDLAADGVLECLDWMYAGAPEWGEFAPNGTTVAFECTDTGDRVLVGLGRFAGHDPRDDNDYDDDDLRVVGSDSGGASATISGTAADLDAWLWHRGDVGIAFAGDEATLDQVRTILRHPLN